MASPSVYSGYESQPQQQPVQNQPGGMPRSRMQQQMDDMLLGGSTYAEPFPQHPRSSSRAGFARRSSISSQTSNRTGVFSWARGKRGNAGAGADYEDNDDDVGDGANIDTSMAQMDINSITGLRDRDRYPTVQKDSPSSPNPGAAGPAGGRTMSISSTMSSGYFDTTPIIPTFRGTNGSQSSNQYRKNLTNARKAAFRTSDIPPFAPGTGGPMSPQQQPPPHGRGSMMNPQYRPPPPPGGGPPRPSYGAAPRLNSMSGPPSAIDFAGQGGPNGRAMSMTAGVPPGFAPGAKAGPPPQRSSRPPSRMSSQQQFMTNGLQQMQLASSPLPNYKRVSASTMTDPINFATSSSTGHSSPSMSNSTVDLGVQTDDTSLSTASSPYVLPPLSTVSNDVDTNGQSKSLTPVVLSPADQRSLTEKDNHISELETMNKSLLDEIRLVTGELSDSIRRELGLADPDESERNEQGRDATSLASKISTLEAQLDLERRKRLLAESKLQSAGHTSYLEGYDMIEIERELAERDRLFQNEQRENELLRENISKLSGDFEDLQLESNQLKTGILPELRSHVEDLELLTAAGNPIELLKQIEELKVENKKIQSLMEENSTRGPLGEKLKAVEQQRDVLREALRSLRERKDHEVRQTADRVRQLESKLEKEKVLSNQMQRKLVQTRAAASSPINPTFPVISSKHSSSSSANNSGSELISPSRDEYFDASSMGNTGHQQRSASGSLQPPSFAFENSERTRSASPVSFEISHEPTWLDSDSRYGRPRQTLLNMPKNRTEQVPLSLGSS